MYIVGKKWFSGNRRLQGELEKGVFEGGRTEEDGLVVKNAENL